MLEKIIMTPLMAVGRLTDLLRSARSSSLVDYTKATRSEPITLIDDTLISLDQLPDILQSVNSIYAGYYLQAIALSVNVGKVDVVRLLEKVNPARDPLEAGGWLIEAGLSAESYHYRLPGKDARKGTVSLEGHLGAADDSLPDTAAINQKSLDVLSTSTNLSVGKMFNVEINSEGNSASIPVSVRLMSVPIDPSTLNNILSYAQKDNSMKERFYGMKSGRLSFIKDGILCRDLIREHRKTLINDRSGVYAEIVKRANKNKISGMLSMNPSVATASNIVLMSSDTARQLEVEIGGRLKDASLRQRMFDKTYLMILVVIDPDYKMIRFYYDGISTHTELSFNDVKNLNKNGAMDVGEVLRTLQLGQSPRF